MEIRQGDIFWVDIPQNETKGSEQYGRRPFLVVSRDAVNKTLKTVVAVPLSTTIEHQPPYRIVIPVQEITKDVLCTSQLFKSAAKTDQVRVMDKSRFQQCNKIGRLSRTAMLNVALLGLGYVLEAN